MKVGACTGDCPEDDAGECTLTTPVSAGEVTFVPAEMENCPDGVGWVCLYIGPVRAECLCAL